MHPNSLASYRGATTPEVFTFPLSPQPVAARPGSSEKEGRLQTSAGLTNGRILHDPAG